MQKRKLRSFDETRHLGSVPGTLLRSYLLVQLRKGLAQGRFSCQQANHDDDGDGDGGGDDDSGGQFAALVRGLGSLGLLLALCANGRGGPHSANHEPCCQKKNFCQAD